MAEPSLNASETDVRPGDPSRRQAILLRMSEAAIQTATITDAAARRHRDRSVPSRRARSRHSP